MKGNIISSHYKKLIMKTYWVYLLSLSFFASVGSHIANNIKENLETRTEKLDSVLSSYSVYLQNK